MVSKTSLTDNIKAFRSAEIRTSLAEKPDLLSVRDDRGRSWLHLLCASQPKDDYDAQASIEIAAHLLDLGLGLDDPAFSEGAWLATPLWFSISRGRNLALAKFLLRRGCNPNYCLYAAVWNEDLASIALLLGHGALVDDDSAQGVTPFVEAIGWSKFAPAQALLEAGADPDRRDGKGRTALHMMLKKGSAPTHFEMLVTHKARGDIRDADGRTAIELLRRKRDPIWHAIADRLVAKD